VVTLDEIAENDHNLTVARYLTPTVEVQRADLGALRAEWKSLGSELAQVQDQLMTELVTARLVAGHD
jgi:type I restriction-modification system DNA methylase subunit